MYATPDDLRARYDPVLLAQLAGTDGGDGDDASLLVALADATAEVNGYVGRRYPVPLVPVPAVIVRNACSIAVYNLSVLQRHQDVEDVNKRYEHSIAFLKRVVSGEIALGMPGDGSPNGQSQTPTTDGAGAAFVEGRSTMFGRDGLRGF